ncbi:MAG TPA: hypothetical protein VLV78_02825 [Thermoanaerobaculia bacterium]|nr:hypothetical protein [Thermoanaerobaculia bacterium]
MMLQPGTRLGPYEVLAPVGAGGMGEVFKARDTPLGAASLDGETLADRIAKEPLHKSLATSS